MKKQFLSSYILTFLFVLTITFSFGQGGNPFDDLPCFPPPCIPIDGGISFLIAAGVGLAGKRLYDKSK